MKFNTKPIIFENGERFSLLLNSDGIPLFWPTVWSIVELRGNNKAHNTIDGALRALQLFYLYLDSLGVDLEERLNHGRLFSFSELEGLMLALRSSVKDFVRQTQQPSLTKPQKVVKLEQYRMGADSENLMSEEVLPGTVLRRVIYIRAYIAYRCSNKMQDISEKSKLRQSLNIEFKTVDNFFESRQPRKVVPIDPREGMSSKDIKRLFELIDHESKENPWHQGAVKFRNYLIISWLYETGMRRGELLNLKVGDINFSDNSVTIIRRPDDKNDPRKYQPLVKTRGRRIPIPEELGLLTRKYISNYRAVNAAAKKHPYLFVATDTGQPLSLKSVNSIFNKVRQIPNGMVENFFPHILRHTWNDRFSKQMDDNKVLKDMEVKLRNEMNG